MHRQEKTIKLLLFCLFMQELAKSDAADFYPHTEMSTNRETNYLLFSTSPITIGQTIGMTIFNKRPRWFWKQKLRVVQQISQIVVRVHTTNHYYIFLSLSSTKFDKKIILLRIHRFAISVVHQTLFSSRAVMQALDVVALQLRSILLLLCRH